MFRVGHHIELPRLPHDLHGGVVDIEMAELDIGEFLPMQRGDLLAPQHAGFQYVCLVDSNRRFCPRPRQLESRARHAANLVGRVLLRVEAAALTVGKRLDATRLAEIDAAGELSDDDEIDTLEHVSLERCRVDQGRARNDRT